MTLVNDNLVNLPYRFQLIFYTETYTTVNKSIKQSENEYFWSPNSIVIH
jgi:hypothetical protein